MICASCLEENFQLSNHYGALLCRPCYRKANPALPDGVEEFATALERSLIAAFNTELARVRSEAAAATAAIARLEADVERLEREVKVLHDHVEETKA